MAEETGVPLRVTAVACRVARARPVQTNGFSGLKTSTAEFVHYGRCCEGLHRRRKTRHDHGHPRLPVPDSSKNRCIRQSGVQQKGVPRDLVHELPTAVRECPCLKRNALRDKGERCCGRQETMACTQYAGWPTTVDPTTAMFESVRILAAVAARRSTGEVVPLTDPKPGRHLPLTRIPKV